MEQVTSGSAPAAEDLLPLKPDVFTILLTLLEGDAHGYAMLKAASDRGGRLGDLQPGSLYRLLRQMLDAGLVEELDRRMLPDGSDERRRYYRITAYGRDVAAAESRRMASLLRISRRHDLIDDLEPA